MKSVNFRDLRVGNLVQCTDTSVNHIEVGDLFEVSYRTASKVVLSDIASVEQSTVGVVVGYEDTIGSFKLLDDYSTDEANFKLSFDGFVEFVA